MIGIKVILEEGQKIGDCVFIKELEHRVSKGGNTRRQGVFRCECGKEFITDIYRVRSGKTQSCGCKSRGYKHGHGRRNNHSPEYSAWAAMIARCYGNSEEAKKLYQEKGVVVCDRWRESFTNFLEDVGYKPSSKHSLDRYPNKNGNYEPDNCRWATPKEQANNLRSNVLVTYNGITRTLSEWKSFIDIPYYILRSRIQDLKWPVDLAFETPVSRNNKKRKLI